MRSKNASSTALALTNEPRALTPEILSAILAAVRANAAAAEPRLLYDRASAAHQLCISTRAVDYLISTGKLKTRRLGRKVMVSYAELTRFASRDHIGDLSL